MAGAVDLHSHTTASDGTFSPRELVQEAARRGVRVLAVTDHDSTEGLAEAMAEAAAHPPLRIVPGIEINCDVDGGAGGVALLDEPHAAAPVSAVATSTRIVTARFMTTATPTAW